MMRDPVCWFCDAPLPWSKDEKTRFVNIGPMDSRRVHEHCYESAVAHLSSHGVCSLPHRVQGDAPTDQSAAMPPERVTAARNDGPSQEGTGGSAADPDVAAHVAWSRESSFDRAHSIAAALEAMARERDSAGACCDSYAIENQQFHDRFTKAEAAAAASAKDAERYRWIRENGYAFPDYASVLPAETLDARVDAAIDAQKGEG